ncbi:hypothetical protein MIS45_10055 [Wielerella bovis]|uniref:hypothetical protein n=1 Tax=Wielerella bovis TaxID=2917790 RepID=UPI002018BD64|nr:hypothetical protein [Wielerella bovis]ULJ60158.1 hypothetical protein MIS44_10965 [Wielerella bovis]ULJ62351.1 hypothetical protein MIS46_10400 [Wielerella bovis]ULJ69083.1 hypothetical protein MIS45_10055 [Wielerella bovis]
MKLPFNYQLIIFKTLDGVMPIGEFETWLYADQKLAQWLPENVYYDLISLNFKDKHILHELDKLLANYLDKNQYLQWQLIQILTQLIQKPDDKWALVKIYDLYCHGYYFMRLLALKYGLCLIHESDDIRFAPESLTEIQQQATWLLNTLENGEIQLFESNQSDSPFHIDYIDQRSEADKQRTDLP